MVLVSFPGLASNSQLSNSDFWTTVFKKFQSSHTKKQPHMREGKKTQCPVLTGG